MMISEDNVDDHYQYDIPSSVPLCVDLDGTLIFGDVTMHALFTFIKEDFFHLFVVIMWFLKGRATLKSELAKIVDISPSDLIYNTDLLKFLKTQKARGVKIYLATACSRYYAIKIADYLGIFDGVFASDNKLNLRAQNKANMLNNTFGVNGYVYAGNSIDDIVVWKQSLNPIIVNANFLVHILMRNKNAIKFK